MEKWLTARAVLPVALGIAAGGLLLLEAIGLVPSAVAGACRDALLAVLKQ